MKWLVADVDDGVLSVHSLKSEAVTALGFMYDNELRSHKVTSGLYRYDAWVGEVWIETGRYVVRESNLRIWNHEMWQAWKDGIDYFCL